MKKSIKYWNGLSHTQYRTAQIVFSGDRVKCIKSLYKSTYKRNAFTKGRKYEYMGQAGFRDKDTCVFVLIKDATGNELAFASSRDGSSHRVFEDYFEWCEQ